MTQAMICMTLACSLATLAILLAVYWHGIRPCLLALERHALYAIRDELRAETIAGGLDPRGDGFLQFERNIHAALATIGQVSLAQVMTLPVPRGTLDRYREKRDVILSAGPAVQKLYQRFEYAAVGACLANSPTWLPVICLMLLARYWSERTRSKCDEYRDRAVIFAPPSMA